jgi:hypothetical protein
MTWNTHEDCPAIDPLEGFDTLGDAWEYLSAFADRADTEPYDGEITFGMLRAAVRGKES